MSDHANSWYSAHVYYYARDRHDDVILDALRPLLTKLESAITGSYFERHWLHGPQLRLHVQAAPKTWSAAIRPLIERDIGRYLQESPSTAVVDIDAALLEHRLLAELEQEAAPLTPWRPDNTLLYLPYDRRQHVLGSEAAADLLTDFHSDVTDVLFRMLERIRQGATLPELCLDLMFALAEVGCPPITRGFISYRSHVEYFLSNCSNPERMRQKFDARYKVNRRALTERLERVLDVLDGKSAGVPFILEWVHLWRHYQRRGERLLDSGKIDLERPAVVRPERSRISAFQQTLEEESIWEEIQHTLWFRSYRLLLNFTYLQMNRLGCTPVERYLFCYLVSRTVEDRFEVAALSSARDSPVRSESR